MEELRILAFISLFLFLSQVFAQEITSILPYETIYYGEKFQLKIKLVDKDGNPIIKANVTAYSDFFHDLQLFDDGNHEDEDANDGIYANNVTASSLGMHSVVIVYKTSESSGSREILIRVSKRVRLEKYLFFGIVLAGISVVFLGYRKSIKTRTEIEKKIKKLEERKKALSELIKKTEQAYFKRILDQNTAKERIEKYKQKIIEIDLELERIKNL